MKPESPLAKRWEKQVLLSSSSMHYSGRSDIFQWTCLRLFSLKGVVPPAGIEPATSGSSVPRSPNWATAADGFIMCPHKTINYAEQLLWTLSKSFNWWWGLPKFTGRESALVEKCYFCEKEITVPTGPGWNSTRVICRDCSKTQQAPDWWKETALDAFQRSDMKLYGKVSGKLKSTGADPVQGFFWIKVN